MHLINDSENGKPYVAMTTRQAIEMCRPEYNPENEHFSMQAVHNRSIEHLKMSEEEMGLPDLDSAESVEPDTPEPPSV